MQAEHTDNGISITLQGAQEIEAVALACADIADRRDGPEQIELFHQLGTRALTAATAGVEPRVMRLDPSDAQVALRALSAWPDSVAVSKHMRSKHYLRSVKVGERLKTLADTA